MDDEIAFTAIKKRRRKIRRKNMQRKLFWRYHLQRIISRQNCILHRCNSMCISWLRKAAVKTNVVLLLLLWGWMDANGTSWRSSLPCTEYPINAVETEQMQNRRLTCNTGASNTRATRQRQTIERKRFALHAVNDIKLRLVLLLLLIRTIWIEQRTPKNWTRTQKWR